MGNFFSICESLSNVAGISAIAGLPSAVDVCDAPIVSAADTNVLAVVAGVPA